MKQNNLKIAITGGIGSGKSTVAQIIKGEGYNVFSCDEIYSELLQDKNFLNRLTESLGDILNGEGELDRAKLSSIIFNDKNKLELLNKITHPAIYEKIFEKAKNINGCSFFEVPLLFEDCSENLFDKVIVVLRDVDKRIKSVMQRDNLSQEQVIQRLNNQYNYDIGDFAKYYVIHNNYDLNYLIDKTKEILGAII